MYEDFLDSAGEVWEIANMNETRQAKVIQCIWQQATQPSYYQVKFLGTEEIVCINTENRNKFIYPMSGNVVEISQNDGEYFIERIK